MRRGRAGRNRKRHKLRQVQQGCVEGDVICAELRKWMVARSSKADLVDVLRLVPYCFPDTGRGLKTKSLITPDTVIVSIPQCLLVTPATFLNSPVGSLLKKWKVTFTPHQVLTLFLILEQNKGINSEWHPFIRSLPSEYTLPHYFSAEELDALPLHVSLAAQRLIQRSHHAHRQIVKFCSAHWKDAEQFACWEIFRWAWCTVSSRSVFLEPEAGLEQFMDLDFTEENGVALCPYLDLLNHNSTARARAGWNQRTKSYEIVADDTYLPHDQVFIYYGPHDNTTLFLHYGFTLPYNVHNNVCFSVDDFVQLREVFHVTCWDQKLDALRKHGLHRQLSCTMEGASWNLLCALNILSMDWKQLQRAERAVMGEEVSPVVEACGRRMARHLIRQALTKCRTHMAKLPESDKLSAHLSLAYSLLTNEHNILTVSLTGLN